MATTWMIASNDLPDPGAFKVTKFPIGSDQRLANGRMVTDIVCYKRKFEISWPSITWNYLSPIFTLYDASSFFIFTYPDRGAQAQTATVKIANAPDAMLKYIETAANDWVFYDFALVLEEQ